MSDKYWLPTIKAQTAHRIGALSLIIKPVTHGYQAFVKCYDQHKDEIVLESVSVECHSMIGATEHGTEALVMMEANW